MIIVLVVSLAIAGYSFITNQEALWSVSLP